MIHRGTYDGTIYHNPVNKFCIISVKTADKEVPQEARSTRRYRDHLIRFVATGYELPRTDAVELELDGEWTKGKYGVQLQVEQWREIVPKTKSGVEGYLASGLIKGIGPATAAQIVSRFGVETLDILQNHPERLLEVKGITESKLEDIKTSYAESRMLQDLMTLLSPFKITPKTALKIYQHFGPASVDILKKSPFELCQVSGFGFLRVDAIVQKNGGDLHDPTRVKGALFWALEDSKGGKGHLFLPGETLRKEALRLLNAKIPVPSLRLHEQEVADVLQDMILHGEVVSVKDNIYLPRTFAQEDETARRIAMRLIEPSAPERIEQALEQVKREMGLVLSSKQEAAVYAAYRHSLSIITGSPGTGKTTVLKTILEVYRRLHPKGEIVLMAPTGRASRRMAESTGFDKARTLHSGLGLGSEEDDANRSRQQEPLSADLIIVDEFSMVDMWLADKFFSRIKDGARVVLVGDPDQLPSVGAGTVFRELIDCGLIPVTVLDQIFRQSKDSLIAYNAKFINEGNTKLYFGPDFVFMASDNQAEAAERIIARYCREIAESGIDRVQILSPFRSEGAASAEQLNEAIREVVNPFRSAEEEIKIGVKVFRVNDRIMQTKNTAKVSNGDLGFIRYIKDDEDGKRIGLDFGVGRELEYSVEDTVVCAAPQQEPHSAPQKGDTPAEGKSPARPIETPQGAFEAARTATVTTAPPEENAVSETVEQHLPVEPEKKFDRLPVEVSPKAEQPAAEDEQADELPVHGNVTELPVQHMEKPEPAAEPVQTEDGTAAADTVAEAPSYTQDTPVEDILKVMTLEQAQQVVVDDGICRGMTIAQVAEKRPVNLRFYLIPGKSKNNMVRAAAQLVLDSLQKAG